MDFKFNNILYIIKLLQHRIQYFVNFVTDLNNEKVYNGESRRICAQIKKSNNLLQ